MIVGKLVTGFMRRASGWDKQHFVELEAPGGGLCRLHVAGVNRIEASTKNRNFHAVVSPACRRAEFSLPNRRPHISRTAVSGRPGRGPSCSLPHAARFRSSWPSPVTEEISESGYSCPRQNSRSANRRLLSPAASTREATIIIGFPAT